MYLCAAQLAGAPSLRPGRSGGCFVSTGLPYGGRSMVAGRGQVADKWELGGGWVSQSAGRERDASRPILINV